MILPLDLDPCPPITDGLLLLVVDGESEGEQVHLSGSTCSIGSDARCTFQLKSPKVHPCHCVIVRGAERTIVRRWDRDTTLNGKEFSDAVLVPGDRLGIGTTELEVIADARNSKSVKEEPPADGERLESELKECLETLSERILAIEDAGEFDRLDGGPQLQRLLQLLQRTTATAVADDLTSDSHDELGTELRRRQSQLEDQFEQLLSHQHSLMRQQTELDGLRNDLEQRADELAAEQERQALAKETARAEDETRLDQLRAELLEAQSREQEVERRVAKLEASCEEADRRCAEAESARVVAEQSERQILKSFETLELETERFNDVQAEREALERKLHEFETQSLAKIEEARKENDELRRELELSRIQLETQTQEAEELSEAARADASAEEVVGEPTVFDVELEVSASDVARANDDQEGEAAVSCTLSPLMQIPTIGAADEKAECDSGQDFAAPDDTEAELRSVAESADADVEVSLDAYMASLIRQIRPPVVQSQTPSRVNPAEAEDANAEADPSDAFAADTAASKHRISQTHLDALRFVANNSARRNIKSHQKRSSEQTATALTVIGFVLFVVALALGYLYLGDQSKTSIFWDGVVSLVASITCLAAARVVEIRTRRRLAAAGGQPSMTPTREESDEDLTTDP